MNQTSSSRLAYQDCYDLLDRALENPRGIRVLMDGNINPSYMRARLHNARQVDRDDNAKTYPPEHVLFGRSTYDQLVIRIREADGKTWLYIERFLTNYLHIEELDNEVETVEVEPAKPVVDGQTVTLPRLTRRI